MCAVITSASNRSSTLVGQSDDDYGVGMLSPRGKFCGNIRSSKPQLTANKSARLDYEIYKKHYRSETVNYYYV